MSARTGIQWAHSTFNPWIGCTKIAAECDHCYAENLMSTRRGVARWGQGEPRVRTSVNNWREPRKWNARPFRRCTHCEWADEAQHDYCPRCLRTPTVLTRRRVFVASLADVFDNQVDPDWRADLWALIRETPNLTWMVLTKRIGNAPSMLPVDWESEAFRHVWLGITAGTQAAIDRDTHKLLAIRAAVHFLSCEPLLEELSLNRVRCPEDNEDGSWKFDALSTGSFVEQEWVNGLGETRYTSGDGPERDSKIDWVIAGGESSHGARPMHPAWVRSLRDQCHDAGTAFFFKQWGDWAPSEAPSHWMGATGGLREVGHGTWASDIGVRRLGKKHTGRMLDGREWSEVPPCS